MKILHLSDPHIGYRDCGERFGALITAVKESLAPPWQYVVLITGDVVDKGRLEVQYEAAKKEVERLEQSGFTVLLVPGNHDYGTGISPSQKFGRLFNEVFYNDPDLTYPILGDPRTPGLIGNVAFLGLDTMEQEVENREYMWGAQGTLGQRQLTRLDDMLSMSDVKNASARVIYMHHHPFDPLLAHRLHDSEDLRRVISRHGNVDAILFGHNHAGWKWHGAWGIARCCDAGSATRKKNMPGYHRVMDLDGPASGDYDGDFLPPRQLPGSNQEPEGRQGIDAFYITP